jgi:hypothetical protein
MYITWYSVLEHITMTLTEYVAMQLGDPTLSCFNLTVPAENRQLLLRQSEVNITRDRIAGLHPQNPRHFPRQLSARVSRTLWSTYLSIMIAVTR